MLNYKEYTSFTGQKFIVATDENGLEKHIPVDENNSDYQAYLNKDKPQVEHLTEIVPGAQKL